MADPITREQVERAIPESTACNAHGVCKALGELWYRREDVPEDVRAGWGAIGYNDLTAALTRWRDELAAAEPVRRVARWDAERQRYMLTPPATTSHQYNPSTADRETASAWGYEIEGGPEPIQTLSRCPDCGGPRTDADEHDAWCDDCWGKRCQPAEDSPERLRERRRGVGWTLGDAARASGLAVSDVDALEGTCRRWPDCDRCGEMRPAYAAALSAEEARLARDEPERPAPRFKVGDLDPVLRETARRTIALLPDLSARPLSGFGFNQLPGVDEWRSGKLTSAEWADQLGALLGAPASPPAPEVAPAPLPERPAPRFKVGDWVRVVSNGAVYQVGEVAIPFGGAYYFRETGGAENSWAAPALEPASPPAPEVVDVPQPITKRCSLDGADIYATWVMDGGVLDLLFVRDDGEHREPVPLALLRAMLEAIDAQQGGAS